MGKGIKGGKRGQCTVTCAVMFMMRCCALELQGES